jgi:heptosyltransferase-1
VHILIVKTSSLGDVLHTLPALSDAAAALPGLKCDWVVEESFTEVPAWHPAVEKIIPVATRRWRRAPFAVAGEKRRFVRALRERAYDRVIDAQGLLKSAILTRLARGPRCGLASECVREPLAARFYDARISVTGEMHAVERLRRLFAACLDYPAPVAAPEYGIPPGVLKTRAGLVPEKPYLMFLHGTTWDSKHWPEAHWAQLIGLASAAGYEVLLPWGNRAEKGRAERLARERMGVCVLPATGLGELGALLRASRGAVAVDSGLSHLAAALGVPCVSIYGPTDPKRTGTAGAHQRHIAARFACAPCLERQCRYTQPAPVWPACFQDASVPRVWDTLIALIENASPRND